jgi:hypothetical protein
MQKQEAALLEKFVNGRSGGVAHAEHRAHGIRTRSQVREGAKELEGMPLLLQRIVFGNRADHIDAVGLQFVPLTLSERIDEFTGCGHRTTGLDVSKFSFEILEFGGGDNLEARETRAIADFEKRDTFRVARGSHPAVQRHRSTRGFSREDLANGLAVDGFGFFAHGLGF